VNISRFKGSALLTADHRVNISRFKGGALLTATFPDLRGLQITDNRFNTDIPIHPHTLSQTVIRFLVYSYLKFNPCQVTILGKIFPVIHKGS